MMRILRFALLTLLALTATAHAQTGSVKSPAQLNAEINADCPDNTIGLCTPFVYRKDLLDIVASYAPASVLANYGAKCDGTTNDDAAISQWLTATVAVGKPASFTGTCAFSTPIVLPDVDNVTIVGTSPGTSVLLYIGASTNTDIISIGTAGVACCAGQHHALMFANWQLKSRTVMTGGTAMHFAQIVRSNLLNWWACGQDCANNFYHGVWFDQVETIRWCGINAQATQDVVRINGQVGGPQSDFWLDCGGKISGGQVGVRIGGAFGGFSCNSVDIIVNNTNVLIDTTLTASGNLQLFFHSDCVNDSAGMSPGPTGTGLGLHVADTLATDGTSGIIVFDNAWLASSTSFCALIDAGVKYPIYFNGGVITNCLNDGIHDNSGLAHVVVTGTRISNITLTGVFATTQTTGKVVVAADFVNVGIPMSTLNVTSITQGYGFDVTKYGAKCDGTTVDYTSVQAALVAAAAVGGGTVLLPPGKNCNIGANTLTIPGSYVTIDGGVQGTNLLFSNVSANDVLIGNGSGLPGYYQTRLRNLTVSDSARTSGQAVQVLGASQPSLYNVQINSSGATVALWAQQFNDMMVDQSFILGGLVTFSPANNAQRSDQFSISNSLILPNTPSQCWHWDGMVQTVNAYNTVMLNCTTGLVVSNNSNNASFYPAFGTFVNLQVDGATAQAVWVQGGYNMQFIGSDLNGSGIASNIPVVQVDPDVGAGGSVTRQVKFIGGGIHDVYGRCLVTNSVDFSLIGTDVYDCGKNAANTYAAIEIAQASGTSSALIANSKIGFATGQGSTSNYGVVVDSTVTGAVLLTGNNYGGNQTGAINDVSGKATVNGGINIDGVSPLPLPTTCTGHPTGSLRNNAGVVNVC